LWEGGGEKIEGVLGGAGMGGDSGASARAVDLEEGPILEEGQEGWGELWEGELEACLSLKDSADKGLLSAHVRAKDSGSGVEERLKDVVAPSSGGEAPPYDREGGEAVAHGEASKPVDEDEAGVGRGAGAPEAGVGKLAEKGRDLFEVARREEEAAEREEREEVSDQEPLFRRMGGSKGEERPLSPTGERGESGSGLRSRVEFEVFSDR
jgi:hypothetical protein